MTGNTVLLVRVRKVVATWYKWERMMGKREMSGDERILGRRTSLLMMMKVILKGRDGMRWLWRGTGG